MYTNAMTVLSKNKTMAIHQCLSVHEKNFYPDVDMVSIQKLKVILLHSISMTRTYVCE